MLRHDKERDIYTEVLNKKEKGSGKQEDNHIGETVGAQRRGGRVPEPVGMTLHAASDSLAPLVHSSTRLVSNTRVHQAKLTPARHPHREPRGQHGVHVDSAVQITCHGRGKYFCVVYCIVFDVIVLVGVLCLCGDPVVVLRMRRGIWRRRRAMVIIHYSSQRESSAHRALGTRSGIRVVPCPHGNNICPLRCAAVDNLE